LEANLGLFILDLALSFIVGGLWVALASVTAQRFGGKVGGFMAGLPVTAVLSIFFITYSEGARHGYEVAGIFPLAISVNAVFLAAFAAFSKRSFLTGLVASLVIWVFIEAILLYCHPVRFGMVLAVSAVLFLISVLFIDGLKIPDPGIQPVGHGTGGIAIRACTGGGVVVMAMVGSRFGGPILGSILSAFPAAVVATLVMTNRYGGSALTRCMARPMMISGVVNCVVFALAYRQMVLELPLLGALAGAYGITFISAIGTFYWINIHRPQSGYSIHG
jgi:hypothetical protein